MLLAVQKETAERLGVGNFTDQQNASFAFMEPFVRQMFPNREDEASFRRQVVTSVVSALYRSDSTFVESVNAVWDLAKLAGDPKIGFSINKDRSFLLEDYLTAAPHIGIACAIWACKSRNSRVRHDDVSYSLLLLRESPSNTVFVQGVGKIRTGWGGNWDKDLDEPSGRAVASGVLQRHPSNVKATLDQLRISHLDHKKVHVLLPSLPWYITLILTTAMLKRLNGKKDVYRISDNPTVTVGPTDFKAASGFPGSKWNWKLFAGHHHVFKSRDGLNHKVSASQTIYSLSRRAFNTLTSDGQYYSTDQSFADWVQNGPSLERPFLNNVLLDSSASSIDFQKLAIVFADMGNVSVPDIDVKSYKLIYGYFDKLGEGMSPGSKSDVTLNYTGPGDVELLVYDQVDSQNGQSNILAEKFASQNLGLFKIGGEFVVKDDDFNFINPNYLT